MRRSGYDGLLLTLVGALLGTAAAASGPRTVVPWSRAATAPRGAAGLPAGWKRSGPDRTFTGERIFDYMDGAGEIPRACGYQSLRVSTYAGPAGARVTVETYDMGASDNAFGLYSMKRAPASRFIALDHRAALGYHDLVLWKGRSTFIVFSEGSKPASDAALLAFARAASARVHDRAALPDLLRSLPRAGYVENSVKLFRGKAALDTVKFVSSDVFALTGTPEVAIAQYAAPKGKAMVVRYPSAQAAAAAMTACGRAPDARDFHLVREGRFLGAVWSAPNAASTQLLVRLRAALRRPGPPWPNG